MKKRGKQKDKLVVGIICIVIVAIGIYLGIDRDISLDVQQISSKLSLVNLELYDDVKEAVEHANRQKEEEIEDSFFHLKLEDDCEVKVMAYVLDLECWFELETKRIGNSEYTLIPMSLMSMYDEPRTVIYEIEVGSKNHTKKKYFAFEGKIE